MDNIDFPFFSAFNASAVKDVQLYKGGFDAKYGGRLSSVVELTGKEGNTKEFNVGGGLSLLSVNGFVEALIYLKNNETVLSSMSTNARKAFEKKYDISVVGKKYKMLLYDL